jgi:hypothetical protein
MVVSVETSLGSDLVLFGRPMLASPVVMAQGGVLFDEVDMTEQEDISDRLRTDITVDNIVTLDAGCTAELNNSTNESIIINYIQ